MDITKLYNLFGVVVFVFLATVQQSLTVTVDCRGATIFRPACCRVSLNSAYANITRTAAESPEFHCVEGQNYYYLFYSQQQSYVCTLFGCGGTFTVTASSSWSSWGAWSSCSANCGIGIQTRSRTCPSGQLSDCSRNLSDSKERRLCVVEDCTPTTAPASWNSWGEWGSCSVTCGAGVHSRLRTCSTGANTDCSANSNANTQSQLCVKPACRSGTVVTTAAPVPIPQSSCGFSPSSLGYRVIGGDPAKNCEYPWMVMVYNRRKSTACGGSIIDATHILTAAHCVVSATVFGTIQPNQPSDLRIFSGAAKMPFRQYVESIPGIKLRTAASVKVHENYNDDTVENDIAIITLAEPIAFDNCHVPICLPTSQQEAPGSTGCKVMGWGTTSNSRYAGVSSDLLYAGVKVEQPYRCTRLYGFKNFNSQNKVCAGGDGTGSCSGDSGGPLTCPTSSGRYYQFGIVSSGASGRCGDLPSMYTKVTSYLPWIKTNTQ